MSNYRINPYTQLDNRLNPYSPYATGQINFYTNNISKNILDKNAKDKRNDVYNIYNSSINSINININAYNYDKKKLQDEILSPYNEDNRPLYQYSNYYYDDNSYYKKSNLNLNKFYQNRNSNPRPTSKAKTNFNELSNSSNLLYDSYSKYVPQRRVYNIEAYKNINHNKKMLILDLDETLVHSSLKPIQYKDHTLQPDIVLKVKFHSNYYNVYVLKRPYVDEFLIAMSKIYNLIIFTASVQEYADPLLDQLDKNKVIKLRYYRNSCTLNKEGKFVKDLSTLYKDLNNVILLDNNPISYSYNKSNGLPIITWHSNKKDKELQKLIPVLEFLSKVKDVRYYIPRFTELEMVNYNKFYVLLNEINKEDEQNEYLKLRPKSTKHLGVKKKDKKEVYNNNNKEIDKNKDRNEDNYRNKDREKDRNDRDRDRDKDRNRDKDGYRDKEREKNLINKMNNNKKNLNNYANIHEENRRYEDKKYQEKRYEDKPYEDKRFEDKMSNLNKKKEKNDYYSLNKKNKKYNTINNSISKENKKVRNNNKSQIVEKNEINKSMNESNNSIKNLKRSLDTKKKKKEKEKNRIINPYKKDNDKVNNIEGKDTRHNSLKNNNETDNNNNENKEKIKTENKINQMLNNKNNNFMKEYLKKKDNGNDNENGNKKQDNYFLNKANLDNNKETKLIYNYQNNKFLIRTPEKNETSYKIFTNLKDEDKNKKEPNNIERVNLFQNDYKANILDNKNNGVKMIDIIDSYKNYSDKKKLENKDNQNNFFNLRKDKMQSQNNHHNARNQSYQNLNKGFNSSNDNKTKNKIKHFAYDNKLVASHTAQNFYHPSNKNNNNNYNYIGDNNNQINNNGNINNMTSYNFNKKSNDNNNNNNINSNDRNNYYNYNQNLRSNEINMKSKSIENPNSFNNDKGSNYYNSNNNNLYKYNSIANDNNNRNNYLTNNREINNNNSTNYNVNNNNINNNYNLNNGFNNYNSSNNYNINNNNYYSNQNYLKNNYTNNYYSNNYNTNNLYSNNNINNIQPLIGSSNNTDYRIDWKSYLNRAQRGVYH